MFRSISRVFFLLICVTGASVAMAANTKIDIERPLPFIMLCAINNSGSAIKFTQADNCLTTTRSCYGNEGSGAASVCIDECKACQDGYTLTSASGTASYTTTSGTLDLCSFTYKTCDDSCTLTCANSLLPRWMVVRGGNYQIRTYKFLDETNCKCVTRNQYRCTAGYYMNDDNAIITKDNPDTSYTPPCLRCPTALDGSSTSTAGNNARQSSCYLSKGDSYSHKVQDTSGLKTNTIGKYRLSVDCYYDQTAK